ncbi:MAG TPA: TonB-dependent receptor [Desulfobacteraceae bacterium]|nr:TonB-dependent receptor [Desulfobacteraceae bacterium]HPJ66573.1 TonB-dependent receptor [Desulfobacteraceae bacterium]HPQ28815.1 TonB-dependent receptor [Desulfobacteraceae bacterium]
MKKLIVLKMIFMGMILWPFICLSQPERLNSETVLDEVVVTATKTEKKRKEVPNSVIILDQFDIQDSPAKSLGELLANEAGIDWRTQGDFGGAVQALHIRGMSGNATHVLVNGVSYNSPSNGIADVSRIPLGMIERVEVIKGSGSLLYGSGAMAGTVNIITKNPERDYIQASAGAGYGSQETSHLSVEHGMFAVGDLGYYITANRIKTDGFRKNADLTQKDASLKIVFDKGDLLNMNLFGDIVDRDYGSPGVKPPDGTLTFQAGGIDVYNHESQSLLDRGRDKDAHLAAQLKSKPEDWLTFRLQGDYTYMDNYTYTRYVDYFGGLPGSKSWVTNRVSRGEANINFIPFSGADILLGLEHKNIGWESESISLDDHGADITGTRSRTKANVHTTGTFLEANYRFSDLVKFQAGIRHEHHTEFGSEDLPLYGMIVNPFENTALKFSHGRHFLAPTPNDLYWPEDPYTRGNTGLLPETGWHSDATFEQAFFNERISLMLSYFRWDIDNKIQWGPNSEGIWEPENLRKYKADGLEIGTRFKPWKNLGIVLFYTYTDAKEQNKAYTKQDYGWPPYIPADFEYSWVTRRSAYTPRHQFKANVNYMTDFGLNATATVRYVGDRVWYRTETDGSYPFTKTVKYELDPYWTVDFRLEQRLYEHWLISFECNNLFDKEYDTYLGVFTDQTTFQSHVCPYPGAGRSVFLKLTYEY